MIGVTLLASETVTQFTAPAASCAAPDAAGFGTEAAGPLLFFLVGLLGGAHCLGMCGPLVTTYADRLRETEAVSSAKAGRSSRRDTLTLRAVRQHALWNLGRTVSYALLGGLFGLVGAGLFLSPRVAAGMLGEIHAVSGLLVGVVIIAAGVTFLLGQGTLGASLGARLARGPLGRLQRWLGARVDAWVGDVRIVGLGGAHGLLPCPLLYPAFLYALVQGSPVGGMVSLAALGLGTIPALFLYATVFQSVSLETRMRLHRLLGVAFILLGYIPLQHGLAAIGIPLPHPPIPYYQPL